MCSNVVSEEARVKDELLEEVVGWKQNTGYHCCTLRCWANALGGRGEEGEERRERGGGRGEEGAEEGRGGGSGGGKRRTSLLPLYTHTHTSY